jgi:peptidoglycan/LPS O-acetylase OafA/YrhL
LARWETFRRDGDPGQHRAADLLALLRGYRTWRPPARRRWPQRAISGLRLATLAGIGLMAAAALALGLTADPTLLSLPALPAHLAMAQAWGLSPVAGWNHPSWSISAKWFARLTFAMFALGAMTPRRWPGLAVAGALSLLASLHVGFERFAGFLVTKATIAWRAANHTVFRTPLRALFGLARQRGGSPQSARERCIVGRQRARLCPIWGV